MEGEEGVEEEEGTCSMCPCGKTEDKVADERAPFMDRWGRLESGPSGWPGQEAAYTRIGEVGAYLAG
jgi:hypothetical protein